MRYSNCTLASSKPVEDWGVVLGYVENTRNYWRRKCVVKSVWHSLELLGSRPAIYVQRKIHVPVQLLPSSWTNLYSLTCIDVVNFHGVPFASCLGFISLERCYPAEWSSMVATSNCTLASSKLVGGQCHFYCICIVLFLIVGGAATWEAYVRAMMMMIWSLISSTNVYMYVRNWSLVKRTTCRFCWHVRAWKLSLPAGWTHRIIIRHTMNSWALEAFFNLVRKCWLSKSIDQSILRDDEFGSIMMVEEWMTGRLQYDKRTD